MPKKYKKMTQSDRSFSSDGFGLPCGVHTPPYWRVQYLGHGKQWGEIKCGNSASNLLSWKTVPNIFLQLASWIMHFGMLQFQYQHSSMQHPSMLLNIFYSAETLVDTLPSSGKNSQKRCSVNNVQNLSETIWHVLDKTSEVNSARLKTEVRPPIRVWFACVATRNAFEVAVEKFLHVCAVMLMKLELFSRTLNSYEQPSIIFKHLCDWKSHVQNKITVIEKIRRRDVCKWKNT